MRLTRARDTQLKVASNLRFFATFRHTSTYDIHKACIQIESQLPIGISNRSLLRYASPNWDKNQNEYVSIKMGYFLFAFMKNLFLFGKLFGTIICYVSLVILKGIFHQSPFVQSSVDSILWSCYVMIGFFIRG